MCDRLIAMNGGCVRGSVCHHGSGVPTARPTRLVLCLCVILQSPQSPRRVSLLWADGVAEETATQACRYLVLRRINVDLTRNVMKLM